MGALCDLLHPDRGIPWRQYFGACTLGILAVVGITGFGVYLFVPETEGPGITISDMQLIFETYLLVMIFMVGLSFRVPFRKLLNRMPIVLASVVVARAVTFLSMSPDPRQLGIHLYRHRFIFETSATVAERASALSAVPSSAYLALTVLLLMAWTYATYAAYHIDHPLSLCLDRIANRQGSCSWGRDHGQQVKGE